MKTQGKEERRGGWKMARGLKTHIENAGEDGREQRMGRKRSSVESGLKSQIENEGEGRMVRGRVES